MYMYTCTIQCAIPCIACMYSREWYSILAMHCWITLSHDRTALPQIEQLSSYLCSTVQYINTCMLYFVQENRESPPISKNQPPVAGAIMWARSLFQRIKGTVLRFQTMKELFDSDAGKAVSAFMYKM